MTATLRLLHFALLCVWGGVLCVEVLLELLGHDEDEASLRAAARAHYWIDVVIEVPLVLAVLTTGALLAIPAWPWSTTLAIKIGAALTAITLNLTCVVLVILRYRDRTNARRLRALHRRIRLTILGVPFGALALYLGLAAR